MTKTAYALIHAQSYQCHLSIGYSGHGSERSRVKVLKDSGLGAGWRQRDGLGQEHVKEIRVSSNILALKQITGQQIIFFLLK